MSKKGLEACLNIRRAILRSTQRDNSPKLSINSIKSSSSAVDFSNGVAAANANIANTPTFSDIKPFYVMDKKEF